MKRLHPQTIQRLISDFKKLPGIGPKSAERLVYHLLRQRDGSLINQLAENLLAVKKQVKECNVCHCLAESETCPVCDDPQRDSSTLCVVEDTVDLLAIDRSGSYRGMYHVLGGVLSPLHGRGPEQLKIASLIDRVRKGSVREILLATNANVEGEATAIYLQGLLNQYQVKTTRLASGIPQGGSLSYLDDGTLARAISGRTEYRSKD